MGIYQFNKWFLCSSSFIRASIKFLVLYIIQFKLYVLDGSSGCIQTDDGFDFILQADAQDRHFTQMHHKED